MKSGTCAVDGCLRPLAHRAWCNAHYQRWWKYGDPLASRPRGHRRPQPVEPRFWAKVDQSDPDGCWLWTGTISSTGYGEIYVDGRKASTHRVSFFLAYGYTPPTVCHHCDNPPCVRPDHLFGGTQGDNSRDMWAKGRGVDPPRTKAKAHCRNGHPYDEANTYFYPSGYRRCRQCRHDRERRTA